MGEVMTAVRGDRGPVRGVQKKGQEAYCSKKGWRGGARATVESRAPDMGW